MVTKLGPLCEVMLLKNDVDKSPACHRRSTQIRATLAKRIKFVATLAGRKVSTYLFAAYPFVLAAKVAALTRKIAKPAPRRQSNIYTSYSRRPISS